MGTHWKRLEVYLLYAEPSHIGRPNRYHMFQFAKIHRIRNRSQPCFLVSIMSIRALSADASTLQRLPLQTPIISQPRRCSCPFTFFCKVLLSYFLMQIVSIAERELCTRLSVCVSTFTIASAQIKTRYAVDKADSPFCH